MITAAKADRQPTRQRLLDAGIRLFADRGFAETTVGDIEAAVGLQPRRGALYRHFRSKEVLLQVALEQHLASIAGSEPFAQEIPSADRRVEALNIGRWLLAELDREQPLVRILEQEGERLSVVRDSFRRDLVDAGYRATAAVVRRWRSHAADTVDVEAVSAILLGSLVNYRRSAWTFGESPLGIDDDRFLGTWADLFVAAAEG